MRKFLLYILSAIALQTSYGQPIAEQFQVVKGDKFEGVIFPDVYKVNFNLGEEMLQKRFTPSVLHIRQSEAAFIEQYNSPIAKGQVVKIQPQIRNTKRHFKDFKRQYLGYINEKGDSLVLIQLLDFDKSPRSQRRIFFSGWMENYIICFGEFCERNRVMFQYNLNSKKLEIPH